MYVHERDGKCRNPTNVFLQKKKNKIFFCTEDHIFFCTEKPKGVRTVEEIPVLVIGVTH